MNRWRLNQNDADDRAGQSRSVEWLSFQDLAERLAEGRISEEDLVLEEGSSESIPVDSIVGLVRAAGRIRRELQSQQPGTSVGPNPVIHPAGNDAAKFLEVRANEATGTPGHDSAQNTAEASVWNQRVSWQRLLLVAIPALIIAAFVWHSWSQASRFPVPARAAQRPVVWSLPVIGNVSTVEFILISLDILLVPVALVIWFRKGKTKE